MKTVAIVDYGMSNLDSVARAVQECGGTPLVTGNPFDLSSANSIILPGVGAFATGMRQLRERQLEEPLRQQVLEKRIPFLGVCLGLQLLATTGWEGGQTAGLGWIEGEVQRLQPNGRDTRLPHVGWNEVHITRPNRLFDGILDGKDFYFVHSFHLVCHHDSDALARTPYCGGFISAVGRNNIWGVQFHPEKSQQAGFQLIRNFLSL